MSDAASRLSPGGRGRIRRVGHMTFSALSVPNYRRYFTGQTISLAKASSPKISSHSTFT